MDFDSEKIIEGVVIYTDGAADPNPGPGGYGVALLCGGRRKELSEGFAKTTNNRMELLGVIAGLEALKSKCSGMVYSDSKYVVDAINKGWVLKWQKNNWWRNKKEMAKNPDLWQRFLDVYEKHDMVLEWVKGHAGVEENEVCDQLAGAASKRDDLPDDTGYAEDEQSGLPQPEAWAKNPKSKVGSSGKKKHKKVGERCRKCKTSLTKRIPKRKDRKPGQAYYYAWYLYCIGCKSMYMVEEAKRYFEVDSEDSGGKEIDSSGSLF